MTRLANQIHNIPVAKAAWSTLTMRQLSLCVFKCGQGLEMTVMACNHVALHEMDQTIVLHCCNVHVFAAVYM